jgi:hypothetical protein
MTRESSRDMDVEYGAPSEEPRETLLIPAAYNVRESYGYPVSPIYRWCIARVRTASDADGDTRIATAAAAYRSRIDIELPSLRRAISRANVSVRVIGSREVKR